jgi:urease accessory protein
MNMAISTITTMARKGRPALLRAKGRPVVRDAPLRGAPHHEAEQAPDHKAELVRATHSPLILRSRPKAGVSKDGGTLAREAAANASALYRLMAWLSPSYPVGAFSYSGGLEWAVEAGDVTDAETLRRWLAVVIGEGGGFCDAVFFAHAHAAATTCDAAALKAVAELAAAFAPSKERHLETTAQGNAFVAATRAAWPCAALDRLVAAWGGAVAYPVAVGVAAAGHGIAAEPALTAYLHTLTASLISAGVRLIPLGQTDGQRVLAALEPLVVATTQRAFGVPLDAVGGAAFRADLASMRHETQYTRLFRS